MKEYNNETKNKIYFCLSNRPYLIPIFDGVTKIPQKVHNFDENAFIVYNKRKQGYELHSLESFFQREELNAWTSYQADLVGEELDESILYYMYRNSFERHGQDIQDKMDYEYNLREKQRTEMGDFEQELYHAAFVYGFNGRVINY